MDKRLRLPAELLFQIVAFADARDLARWAETVPPRGALAASAGWLEPLWRERFGRLADEWLIRNDWLGAALPPGHRLDRPVGMVCADRLKAAGLYKLAGAAPEEDVLRVSALCRSWRGRHTLLSLLVVEWRAADCCARRPAKPAAENARMPSAADSASAARPLSPPLDAGGGADHDRVAAHGVLLPAAPGGYRANARAGSYHVSLLNALLATCPGFHQHVVRPDDPPDCDLQGVPPALVVSLVPLERVTPAVSPVPLERVAPAVSSEDIPVRLGQKRYRGWDVAVGSRNDQGPKPHACPWKRLAPADDAGFFISKLLLPFCAPPTATHNSLVFRLSHSWIHRLPVSRTVGSARDLAASLLNLAAAARASAGVGGERAHLRLEGPNSRFLLRLTGAHGQPPALARLMDRPRRDRHFSDLDALALATGFALVCADQDQLSRFGPCLSINSPHAPALAEVARDVALLRRDPPSSPAVKALVAARVSALAAAYAPRDTAAAYAPRDAAAANAPDDTVCAGVKSAASATASRGETDGASGGGVPARRAPRRCTALAWFCRVGHCMALASPLCRDGLESVARACLDLLRGAVSMAERPASGGSVAGQRQPLATGASGAPALLDERAFALALAVASLRPFSGEPSLWEPEWFRHWLDDLSWRVPFSVAPPGSIARTALLALKLPHPSSDVRWLLERRLVIPRGIRPKLRGLVFQARDRLFEGMHQLSRAAASRGLSWHVIFDDSPATTMTGFCAHSRFLIRVRDEGHLARHRLMRNMRIELEGRMARDCRHIAARRDFARPRIDPGPGTTEPPSIDATPQPRLEEALTAFRVDAPIRHQLRDAYTELAQRLLLEDAMFPASGAANAVMYRLPQLVLEYCGSQATPHSPIPGLEQTSDPLRLAVPWDTMIPHNDLADPSGAFLIRWDVPDGRRGPDVAEAPAAAEPPAAAKAPAAAEPPAAAKAPAAASAPDEGSTRGKLPPLCERLRRGVPRRLLLALVLDLSDTGPVVCLRDRLAKQLETRYWHLEAWQTDHSWATRPDDDNSVLPTLAEARSQVRKLISSLGIATMPEAHLAAPIPSFRNDDGDRQREPAETPRIGEDALFENTYGDFIFGERDVALGLDDDG
jgi:hypothetical protein